jgi:hypothetical protein
VCSGEQSNVLKGKSIFNQNVSTCKNVKRLLSKRGTQPRTSPQLSLDVN